jgi:hypothetical protein
MPILMTQWSSPSKLACPWLASPHLPSPHLTSPHLNLKREAAAAKKAAAAQEAAPRGKERAAKPTKEAVTHALTLTGDGKELDGKGLVKAMLDKEKCVENRHFSIRGFVCLHAGGLIWGVAEFKQAPKVEDVFIVGASMTVAAEMPNWMCGPRCNVIANVQRLKEPVAAGGHQGMWPMTADVLAAVRADLAGGTLISTGFVDKITEDPIQGLIQRTHFERAEKAVKHAAMKVTVAADMNKRMATGVNPNPALKRFVQSRASRDNVRALPFPPLPSLSALSCPCDLHGFIGRTLMPTSLARTTRMTLPSQSQIPLRQLGQSPRSRKLRHLKSLLMIWSPAMTRDMSLPSQSQSQSQSLLCQ